MAAPTDLYVDPIEQSLLVRRSARMSVAARGPSGGAKYAPPCVQSHFDHTSRTRSRGPLGHSRGLLSEGFSTTAAMAPTSSI